MRKIQIISTVIITIIAVVSMQQVLADSVNNCDKIAEICLSSGYVKHDSANKGIWKDCMKPVLLGKTVESVTLDPAIVKACRSQKISELQVELKELMSVKD
tara:strand:- start:1124 stop:1426 length:303 start_codon:yes stop_codon:yes gene_type:complete